MTKQSKESFYDHCLLIAVGNNIQTKLNRFTPKNQDNQNPDFVDYVIGGLWSGILQLNKNKIGVIHQSINPFSFNGVDSAKVGSINWTETALLFNMIQSHYRSCWESIPTFYADVILDPYGKLHFGNESLEWKNNFLSNFITGLDSNEMITVVDCHRQFRI